MMAMTRTINVHGEIDEQACPCADYSRHAEGRARPRGAESAKVRNGMIVSVTSRSLCGSFSEFSRAPIALTGDSLARGIRTIE